MPRTARAPVRPRANGGPEAHVAQQAWPRWRNAGQSARNLRALGFAITFEPRPSEPRP